MYATGLWTLTCIITKRPHLYGSSVSSLCNMKRIERAGEILASRKAAKAALKHEMGLPVYKASLWGRRMGKKRNNQNAVIVLFNGERSSKHKKGD